MRIHTNLDLNELSQCLLKARHEGHITGDVHFVVHSEHGSRSHERAFEIQLGTYDKHSLPEGTKDQHGKVLRVRRFKNSGTSGASRIYAATWDEWGWFLRRVYAWDRHAVCGWYQSREDFNAKTHNAYRTIVDEHAEAYAAASAAGRYQGD